jgi:predicted TIM-barrel fold metal-dependent hydrolase
MISNGEFAPEPQTPDQRRVEERIKDLGDRLARPLGLDRRRFLKTAAGMAAAFMAMNDVYGKVFDVSLAEAADPEAAAERAAALAHQFIFDAQVHFVKDDVTAGTNPETIFGIRQQSGPFLNSELRGREHDIDDIKFQNFVKEVFFDSDTKLAILSGAPSDNSDGWFLSNEQMATARELVNEAAGSRRLLSHAVVTPGQDGWMDDVEKVIEELKPDSWKGYTMGDPMGPSKYMWRLDDEELLYPFYERIMKAGITNICLHKGLLPPNAEETMPGVTAHGGVGDVGKAAKDWPQLNFIIYHSAFNVLFPSEQHKAAFEETGQIDWVSELARIPEEFGVSNVFPEVGSSFGISSVINPRFCAGMMGMLIKGFGEENVFWGTDSVWYGSPQWQIEALRRMEIPEDLQKKFGYAPLGDADGPVKRKILGLNSARHYGINVAKTEEVLQKDSLSARKAEYLEGGEDRSNLAYGFIAKRI